MVFQGSGTLSLGISYRKMMIYSTKMSNKNVDFSDFAEYFGFQMSKKCRSGPEFALYAGLTVNS